MNELKFARMVSTTQYYIIGTSTGSFYRGGTVATMTLSLAGYHDSFIYSSDVSKSCYTVTGSLAP